MSIQSNSAESFDFDQVTPLAQILSAMPISDWRGSITTFQGFTGTKPVKELVGVTWEEASKLMCPQTPALLADKKDGEFFVPCALKEAPLVGNTLDAAKNAGQATTGKMRSKQHVTEATMLVMDVDGLTQSDFDAGLTKMKADGLTFVAYTTHSHGSEDKPGVRARIAVPLDSPADIESYADASHGFDKRYFNGKAGEADPSGAKLYQQQGTWCCDRSRVRQVDHWEHLGGVASTDTLIAIGVAALASKTVQSRVTAKSVGNIHFFPSQKKLAVDVESSAGSEHTPSDANKIADACQQIGTFRDAKGAGQSEPSWYDCLGIVGHCVGGDVLAQEWSSGHKGYDEQKTANKLGYRMKTPPTTCAQLQSSNPAGCRGCAQTCNSPITLGRAGHVGFNPAPFEVVEAPPKPLAVSSPLALPEPVAIATPTPVPPLNDDTVIASLASMKAMDYDRVRNEQAKKLGVQVKTLDEMVKKARNEDTQVDRLPFPEVEPFPDPIDSAQLFDEISDTILQYIVLSKEQADAATLWIGLTWLIDIVAVAPIAIITAPEKACGKSQLLDVLGRLVARPLSVASMSSAFLFRAIKAWKPTLLIDEADTFIRENEELKGLVNAGHTRANAYVGRTVAVGDDHEPRLFDVWGAKAFAGINLEKHLPDSTMSRGIIFNLRRKMPHETVSRLRNADSAQFELIVSKLARFAADFSEQVKLARPDLPDELNDRAQDNWEPLLAIAGRAGDEWVARATAAALILSSSSEETVSTGNELLADILYIFELTKIEKIRSTDLIEALCEIEEGAWATYNRGRPISPRQLSRLLATYKIRPKTVRMKHNETPKGYDLGQFSDAFARYLAPPELPQRRNISPEAMPFMAPGVALDPHTPTVSAATPPLDIAATLNPLLMPCGDVAGVAATTEGASGIPPGIAF